MEIQKENSLQSQNLKREEEQQPRNRSFEFFSCGCANRSWSVSRRLSRRAGWGEGRVGIALTVGGIITVALQSPAGAIVDRLRSKRLILILGCAVLAAGALLLSFTAAPWAVYTSQVLIGAAGRSWTPLAAITMGTVGVALFDRQFGRNQAFNSAANVAAASLDRWRQLSLWKSRHLHYRSRAHNSYSHRSYGHQAQRD